MSEQRVVAGCPVCVSAQRDEIEHALSYNANWDAGDIAAKFGIAGVVLSPEQLEADGAHGGNLPTAGEHVRRHRAHFVPTRPTE